MSVTWVPVALRRLVRERAGNNCEYCGISEQLVFAAHQVDHILAEKHGGKTSSENLALACTLCNWRKGTDLTSLDPETGNVVILFNPRLHQWSDHFQAQSGRIEPLTPIGRVTARILGFNNSARVAERLALGS